MARRAYWRLNSSKPATGWTSVVLVALMLLTVAWSVQSADYADGLSRFTPVVLGGVLVGALLGAQRWLPASLAHGWSIVAGILATAYFGTFALSVVHPCGLDLASRSTLERMTLVRDWFVEWALGTGGLGVVRDEVVPFAFVVTMALLLWLLSYICTWFVVRYVNWWGCFLPSGFALLFNLYQAPEERLTGMAFFLLCGLLLAQQTHVVLQVDRWQRERIGYSPDIGFDFMRDGLVVALVVTGLGWMAPVSLTSERFSQALQRVTGSSTELEQRFNRLFPNLNYPVRASGGGAFGSAMPLGGSIALGQQAIFDAAVDGHLVEPRYWRMAVFDTYDGAGWLRTFDDTLFGDAHELDLAYDYAATVPVTQTIRTFLDATEQLYAMPQPESFSVPVRAETAARDGIVDVLTVASTRPLAVGDGYEVVSRQSIADAASLSAVGTVDPELVRERYLGLPASLPDRVRDEARRVTAGTTSRFEAAGRIEHYLRQFDYSEEISTPPEGIDRVEWFLFVEQRGYCDYYSSAFVVLARSVGIPSRIAAGYSRGDYLPEAQAYRQHAYDAHTWPEVFFPGYGWIEFEPTAADDPLERASTDETSVEDPRDDGEGAGSEFDGMMGPDEFDGPYEAPGLAGAQVTDAPLIPTRWLWAAMAALAVSGLSLATAYVAWQRPLRGLTAAESAFSRLARVAGWLGFPHSASDTPHEYGHRLAGAIPEGRAQIAAIVDAFVLERFGRRPSSDGSAALARAWSRLRLALLRAAAPLGIDRWRDR